MSWVFMPMSLLGIDEEEAYRASALNLLYQFLFHTETIHRLPQPLETVLNTPSHHRVHHGSNPQYLNKNYGGILITWDKLFGTFEPEARRVRYGLTKNIKTFNPIQISYHEFIANASDIRSARGWRHKLGYVFRGPGWSPASS